MKHLETGFMTVFWHSIMERFNKVNGMLQSATLELIDAVHMLNSLRDFVLSVRDLFDKFEIDAKYKDKNKD